MSYWQAYSPTEHQPWDARRVVHLHRRVVFGGTWNELQRDLNEKPQDAVSRLLSGEFRLDGLRTEFDGLASLVGNAAIAQPNVNHLKAWWVYRVLFTPDPLRERLTLMWHNHFATSNLKVNSLPLMKQQNDTLRTHANGRFGDMLNAMLNDPAMLNWLDAVSNRKGHANENLGRELMELFTLGIGHYSESDVKNAARALTGLGVEKGQFEFDSHRHDDGEKTILGQTRRFDAQQLADLLVDQPATADRIAGRLIGEFFGEGVVTEAAREELAVELRKSNLDIAAAVETILRSQLFFSDANINTRVCDPLSFLIAPLRALELFDEPTSTLVLSDWLRRMGLDLFYPPNVAGWPGGRAWLTTRTVIARANYAAAILSGEIFRPTKPMELKTLAARYSTDLEDILRALLLGGANPEENSKQPTGAGEANLVMRLLTSTQAHLH